MSAARSNRVRVRFTGKGHLFTGLCIALYFSALTSQSGLLLLIIGLVVGCTFLNAVLASRCVKWVKLEAPEQTHLGEGESTAEPWQLTNLSKRTARWISVRQAKNTLLRVGNIEPGQKISVAPTLTFVKRGVYPLSKVLLASSYPFGLTEAKRDVELDGEVVVYPAIYPAPVVPAAGFDLMLGGKHKGNRRSLSGASFAGVRKMEPGDPFRNIHWKSSSKGQGLMVKTFDEELSGRICFVVDTSATAGASTLDDTLRAAGSLMFAALDEGHHVEWIDLGTGEHKLVPPFADGHELLDDLARVLPARGALTETFIASVVEKMSRRSAVCFVTPKLTDVLRNAATRLLEQRRVVSVCVAENAERIPGTHLYRYEAKDVEAIA